MYTKVNPKAGQNGPMHVASSYHGRFLITSRLSGSAYLGNCYAPENFEHMAEKISLRYVEIRGLFGFRCT